MSQVTQLAANGNTPFMQHPGGFLAFEAAGTFGGGTLVLQKSDNADGSSPYNYPSAGTSFTAASSATPNASPGWYRASLSGATAPAITVTISTQR